MEEPLQCIKNELKGRNYKSAPNWTRCRRGQSGLYSLEKNVHTPSSDLPVSISALVIHWKAERGIININSQEKQAYGRK